MSKAGLEEAKEEAMYLRSMVDRIWRRQVKMGIAIPREPLPATLRKKLRQKLARRPKRKR